MDPITLATVTSAVTLLATECGKGLASEAGKATWSKIRSLLGWQDEPTEKTEKEFAPAVARRLEKDEVVVRQIVALLQEQPAVGTASALVGSIQADKVVVAETLNVSGDFNM